MDCRASRILGRPVRSGEGREVGIIDDLVLDAITGRVAYAVVEPADGLGRDGELLPVPWAALSVGRNGNACVLNVSRRMLQRAPAIDESEIADITSRHRAVEIFAFYGFQPFWERSA